MRMLVLGELHLRSVLNLKDPGDVELFHTVALENGQAWSEIQRIAVG